MGNQVGEATHICAVCGALWADLAPMNGLPDGGWSLKSPKCGACCDNAEMGIQIVPLAEVDNLAASLGESQVWAAEVIYADRLAEVERQARGSCAKCAHYKPDPEAGRRYFGLPNEHSGWCTNPAVREHSIPVCQPIMMSGDWCQKFERKEG